MASAHAIGLEILKESRSELLKEFRYLFQPLRPNSVQADLPFRQLSLTNAERLARERSGFSLILIISACGEEVCAFFWRKEPCEADDCFVKRLDGSLCCPAQQRLEF